MKENEAQGFKDSRTEWGAAPAVIGAHSIAQDLEKAYVVQEYWRCDEQSTKQIIHRQYNYFLRLA